MALPSPLDPPRQVGGKTKDAPRLAAGSFFESSPDPKFVWLNIERQDAKLFSIFLVGQNELRDRLREERNRALRPRAAVHCHSAVTFMDPIAGLTKENSNEEDTPKRGFLLRLEALMKKDI